jgi:hypothetical protein
LLGIGGHETRHTTFTKKNLKLGEDYLFAVSTVNTFGQSASTHPIARALVIASTAPRDVHALSGKHSVAVSWKQPADPGGAAIGKYRVEYGTCPPGSKGCHSRVKVVRESQLVALLSSRIGVTLHGLKKGTSYDVRVIARTKHGLGKPSRVAHVTTQG